MKILNAINKILLVILALITLVEILFLPISEIGILIINNLIVIILQFINILYN